MITSIIIIIIIYYHYYLLFRITITITTAHTTAT